MSETPPDPAPKPDHDLDLDSRVSSLETGQENITGKIDKILGIISGGGPAAPDGPEPGGPNVAQEIRDGVDRLRKLADDAEAKSKTEPKAEPPEPEKPPAPMPRRIEKFMGW